MIFSPGFAREKKKYLNTRSKSITMPLEKLNDLEKSLGNSYNENLGIRFSKNSPTFREISKIAGNTKEIKKMLNLN
jgi:hypothetical protein